jgi:dTDP-4-amino-4,6-dideoxygalactose transaminase
MQGILQGWWAEMKISMADLAAQNETVGFEIREAIQGQLNAGEFIGGNSVTTFEAEFANFIGVKNCIGTGNGTDALEIAIEALGLKPNSEIIVPAMSFIATSEAVTRSGHRIKFVDVDKYMNLNVEKLEANISANTGAIIVVHLYGQPANLSKIIEIARRNNLYVIEDCAQAAGTKYQGSLVGSFGDISAFSFYPGKNLGAIGDAGAIITNSDLLAKKSRMIANHGRVAKYEHEFEGRNSRLDSIQAAVLSVKLKQLESWISKRQEIAMKYRNAFQNNLHYIPLPIVNPSEHTYHQFVGECSKRELVIKALETSGIATSVHYPKAIPMLDAYKNEFSDTCKDFYASYMADRILSIPVHEMMSTEEVDYVISQIKKIEVEFE